MNKKGFTQIALLLIIVGLVAGGIGILYFLRPSMSSPISSSPPPATLEPTSVEQLQLIVHPPASNNSDQLYWVDADSGGINIFDGLTGATSSFVSNAQTSLLWFTRDGQKIIFDGMNHGSLYLYDFNKGSVEKILTEDMNPTVEFSPDDKYIVVDTGCCPGNRGKTFIEFATRKTIFETAGMSVLWSPDGKKFVVSRGTIDLIATAAQVTNDSIYLGYPKDSTVEVSTLFEATLQESFRPLKWSDNDNLVYEQITYEKAFPDSSLSSSDHKYWLDIYENGKPDYFRVNVNTRAVQRALRPDIPKIDYYADRLSPSGDWRVVYTNKDPNTVLVGAWVRAEDGSKQVGLGKTRIGDGLSWRPR